MKLTAALVGALCVEMGTIAAQAEPRTVATARAGDPDAAALSGARLAHYGCGERTPKSKARIQAELREMNRQVDEQLAQYLSTPICRPRPRGAIGDSFGAGGLGLSGIGEGGGGYGEGIGLGSVGHASSASGTNNQVAGVDEADIVKNDGAYIYLAQNGALRIVEALRPRVASITRLGEGEARKLLLDGDRALVVVALGQRTRPECTYAYDCAFGGDGTRTELDVFDVADRAHPKKIRTIELSGSLVAARRIGHSVHTVVVDGDRGEDEMSGPYPTTPPDLDWNFCRKADDRANIAKWARMRADNARKILAAKPVYPTLKDGASERDLCEILTPKIADGGAYTTLVSFDLFADTAEPTTVTIQSRPGAVFASTDALYMTTVHERGGGPSWYGFYGGEREVSDVHKFRIGAAASKTAYVGSGVVPGHVLNQFSMDEWHRYLRLATSRGRVPDPKVESAVSILAETAGGDLVRVGAVEHLAPGEDIRAVRFDDDRGYVVTFKKTDPLFVLDLERPAQPRVLGELKIPGFSTYLHRIDRTHLLSIGFDADDHGTFAFFNGLLLQLFDVTTATAPRLLFREAIGTRGSSSAAAIDHLAFNYFGDRNLLAIPATICEGGGNGVFGTDRKFSGLLVYDVTIGGGFHRRGGVDHGDSGADCNTWWSNARSQVQRSIFMDDLVFSIAEDRMKVQRLSALGKDLADIDLER